MFAVQQTANRGQVDGEISWYNDDSTQYKDNAFDRGAGADGVGLLDGEIEEGRGGAGIAGHVQVAPIIWG